jgi:choline dehydrogenase-like flavoprotein
MRDNDNTFDYIIIGAGTAGSLMANRLSADRRKRVLLIEAGRKDDYHWIHIPVGYLYCIGNPRTDWLYSTEPDAGLNGRVLRYPRGKTLGGSSSINGMIYMRGQSRDYEQWAALTGDDAWRWQNVLPAFKKHEDHYLGADEMHGAGGEWRVEKQRLRWDILDAFAAAAEQAGVPHSTDFNRGSNEGVGYFQVNQKNGWRWNTAKAFLRPTCYGRPNFELWTGAQVSRLLFESLPDGTRRCTGAEVWNGTEMTTATATREVVLSAGAIGSPQILQLSGIGPAELLRQHGIDVVLDAPGVGANLQDHLQIRAVYKIDGAPTLNVMASSMVGKAKIGLEYLMKRSGPMSMAPSQLGAFTRSSPELRMAEPAVPRAAAVARRLRRSAACLSCLHRERVQPQPDEPGLGAHQEQALRRRAGHRAQLPEHRRRPQGGGRLAARDAPHRRAARAGQVQARRSGSPACSTRPTKTSRAWPATSPPPSSIRWAPRRWAPTATRWPCSMRTCACAACRACAWSMRARCPPSRAATPTARR